MAIRRPKRTGRLQPTRCDACGSEALRPVPWHRRLAYWFAYGRGGPVAVCAVCGETPGSRAYMVMRKEPAGGPIRRLLRTGVGVAKAVRSGRAHEPVPRFYATLAAAAVPPALLCAALAPRRRRLLLAGLPVASMIGGFVWSLMSARNDQTRRSIAYQLAPRRAAAGDLQSEIERIRRAAPSLILLQPERWDGEVSIGGIGWSSSSGEAERVTQVSVVADHGDNTHDGLPQDRRRLDIETSVHRVGMSENELLERVADLEAEAAADPSDRPASHDPADIERWFAERDARRRARVAELPGWRDAAVTIDGVATSARLAEGEGVAVATLEFDGQHLRIEAIGVPVDGLALTRITDVEPLLAVMRARRSRGWDAVSGE